MVSLKNWFGVAKKSVITVDSLDETTRDGISKAYIPKFLYKPIVLNSVGVYNKVCLKESLYVKNVEKNSLHMNVKIENSVQMFVDLQSFIEIHQKKDSQERTKFVYNVVKNFMSQNGENKRQEENIVQENVMQNQNQFHLKGKEILNTKMEELSCMVKSIYRLNGENCEKKFIKEIIGLVKIAIKKVENYTLTILYQLENVKTHLMKKILLHYAENAILKDIMEVTSESKKLAGNCQKICNHCGFFIRDYKRRNQQSIYTQILVSLVS